MGNKIKKKKNSFAPSILFKERLELNFQYELGLITDVKSARRREVRTRTSLLYVQKKYNLIREELEGFTQLIIETTMCLERLKELVYRRQTGAGLRRTIEDTAENLLLRILSLIGHYSLDSNRVIDIILDIFIINIADHYEFFLHFLQISPWCTSGETKDTNSPTNATGNSTLSSPLTASNTPHSLNPGPALPPDSDNSLNIIKTPSFNGILNEVLATKFTGHNIKSSSKDVSHESYLMAGLLIKHKLADLEYLYSRLSPPDSEMDDIYKNYIEQLKREDDSSARFQSQSVCIFFSKTMYIIS